MLTAVHPKAQYIEDAVIHGLNDFDELTQHDDGDWIVQGDPADTDAVLVEVPVLVNEERFITFTVIQRLIQRVEDAGGSCQGVSTRRGKLILSFLDLSDR